MSNFGTPQWESNDLGDRLCDRLFKDKHDEKNRVKMIRSQKKNVTGGKIKKFKNKQKKLKINQNVIQSLQNIIKNSNLGSAKGHEVSDSENILENSFNENELSKKLRKRKKQKNKKMLSEKFKGLLHNLKDGIKTTLNKEDEEKKMLFSEDNNTSRLSSKSSKPDVKKSQKGSVRKNLTKLKTDINQKVETKINKAAGHKRYESATVDENSGKIQINNQKKSKNLTKLKSDIINLKNSKLGEFKNSQSDTKRKNWRNLSLKDRMLEVLKASRFRYLNEQMYSMESKDALKLFKNDPDSYQAYHEGYRQQVNKWPVNPVDIIIKAIRNVSKSYVIADFGCGDAKISKEVEQKVHSFDLVANNDQVIACDMANVPLEKESVDIVVFCLSLMGTNLHDYLKEANRVLKVGGIMKIAEVESRFDDIDNFLKGVQHFGFQNILKDLSCNIFYFLDFKKITNVKKTKSLPTLSLHPCLYKKR